MDIRALRYFADVVDYGSIGRAAVSLGVSQPAVTKCIKQLEQRLKVSLLERGPRGVTPTVYGHALWLHAKSITAEVARAEDEIAQLSQSTGSTLAIGVLPSLTSNVIPGAVLHLSRTNPRLKIRVIERPSADLMSALIRGEFDLIISVIEPDALPPNISGSGLIRDRTSLIVSAAHDLAGKSGVPWKEIRKYPWVLPPAGSRRRGKLDALFTRGGGSLPAKIIECHSVAFMKAVVRHSDYVGILTGDVPHAEEVQGLLSRVEAVEMPPSRTLGFMYRNDHPISQAARSLIREIQRLCDQGGDATVGV